VFGLVFPAAVGDKLSSDAVSIVTGVVDTGAEWVENVGGPRNALTIVGAIGTAAKLQGAAAVSYVSASATAAFTAPTLGTIGAAGAGAVGVAAVAVTAAGVGGYAAGTVINKKFIEPLLDKAAPGSGALGDWYYRTFLK